MRPVVTSVGPLAAASATNIRTASAIAGAGAVTLNGALVSGGIATLDKARRVIFTSSGNDSGITFTTVGTNNSGNAIGEVVTGSNGGAASTVLDYKTLSSVTASGAAAGTVAIGTNGVAASPWVRLDDWGPQGAAIQCDVNGTVNYTVQQTLDDPNSPTNSVAVADVVWINSSDSAVVAATTSQQSNYNFAPAYSRVLMNSGTGTVTMTLSQTGTPQR